MPSWPLSLPGFPLAESFRESAPDATLRTPMDQGPAKLRRRTTAAPRDIFVSYVLDRPGVEALDAFYQDDLEGGSLAFDFSHPRTQSSVSCRFKKPPEYASLNGDYFRVMIELEILP